MDILNINFDKYLPVVIDAYTELFGEEYRDTISKNINNTHFIIYNNLEGIKSYYKFLSDCKTKELLLKFLNQIGLDLNIPIEMSYADDFGPDFKIMVDVFFGNLDNVFLKEDIRFGLKSFIDNSEDFEKETMKDRQIAFMNYWRGSNKKEITKETFEKFKKTFKYKRFLKLIKRYLSFYDELL